MYHYIIDSHSDPLTHSSVDENWLLIGWKRLFFSGHWLNFGMPPQAVS